MNYIVKILLGRWLKTVLDAIPGNGWKTALGLCLIALNEVAKLAPEYAPLLAPVTDVIAPYADVITDMGVVTLLIGLVHKIAKFIGKEDSGTKVGGT